jgi:hypothetical protein
VATADRFEAVMEPTDRWFVWDKVRDLPAEHPALAVLGLSYSQAKMHCQLLNMAEASHRRMADQSRQMPGPGQRD